MSPCRGKDWVCLLAVPYKIVGFLDLGSSAVTQTHCMYHIPLAFLHRSCEIWVKKRANTSMKLMLLAVPRVMKLFVSDPEVLCFLLTFMKL